MPERHELETLFLANLALVDAIAERAARQQGIRSDAADFASVVRLRLVANDYAVLGKLRDASVLPAYLATVITMFAREYRVQHWGRWRPSAEAQRRGPLAIRLETLVYRDRYSLSEAGELLRTRGETTASDRDLSALLAALPVRPPRQRDAADMPSADDISEATESADAVVLDAETAAERVRTGALLQHAIESLPAEDQVTLRLHYWQGLSIADVARALRLEQRPLYRRIERARDALRRTLESNGVSPDRVRSLLVASLPPGAPPRTANDEFEPQAPETAVPRPSISPARPWRSAP